MSRLLVENVSFGPLVPYQPYIFYLQVQRNQTTPFRLRPILNAYGHWQIATASGSGQDSPTVDDNTTRNTREHSDGEDNGQIEYQRNLKNLRSPDEWTCLKGTSFLRLAQSCPSRECRMNPSRGSPPTTWATWERSPERETARAMFY
jgi:hypothetical protein